MAFEAAVKIFRIIGGEFKAIPDEDQTDESGTVTQYGLKSYMELFADQISCRRFGKSYDKALAYLTAHNLKMMDKGDSVEADGLGSMALGLRLSSASEGETSVSFGAVSSSSGDVDADFALTVYGREFLKLRRAAIVPIISSGEPVPNLGQQWGHESWCPTNGDES